MIKGADYLVAGASAVAKKYNVSEIVIGLTIVSFGTSAPELLVNIIASFQGANDLAIGNILGSNISNTLLILGVSAIIYPLVVGKGTVYREIPFSLFSVVLLWIFVNDNFFKGEKSLLITRFDAIILLAFFLVFLYYTFGTAKTKGDELKIETYSTWVSAAMILAGMVGMSLGAKWIVDGGIVLGERFGMSQAFIGLTVVALGTSLPELATSALAAYRKNSDIAIGNIVGSNIFNVLWILGFSALIKPLHFSSALNSDIYIVLISTIILFLFMFIGKKNILQRWQGAVLVLMYVIYVGYLFVRG